MRESGSVGGSERGIPRRRVFPGAPGAKVRERDVATPFPRETTWSRPHDVDSDDEEADEDDEDDDDDDDDGDDDDDEDDEDDGDDVDVLPYLPCPADTETLHLSRSNVSLPETSRDLSFTPLAPTAIPLPHRLCLTPCHPLPRGGTMLTDGSRPTYHPPSPRPESSFWCQRPRVSTGFSPEYAPSTRAPGARDRAGEGIGDGPGGTSGAAGFFLSFPMLATGMRDDSIRHHVAHPPRCTVNRNEGGRRRDRDFLFWKVQWQDRVVAIFDGWVVDKLFSREKIRSRPRPIRAPGFLRLLYYSHFVARTMLSPFFFSATN